MTSEGVTFLAEQIEHVPIDSIEPHPANPNQGDVGAISESIDAVGGFYNVVFVQRATGRIIAGEHRWRTLHERGAQTAPVVYLDVDDATALRIMVGDNEIPRRTSHADEPRLAELLVDLAQQTEQGLAGTGFDGDGLDRLLADLVAPGHSSPSDAKPLPTGVPLRIGDYSGHVSDAVYESFRTAYEQRRAESDEVILDDVLSVWLGL